MPKVNFDKCTIGTVHNADHINVYNSSGQNSVNSTQSCLSDLESIINSLEYSKKTPILDMFHTLEKEINHSSIDVMKKRYYLHQVKRMLQEAITDHKLLETINGVYQRLYKLL